MSERCITCADEGVPMRVLQLDEARGLALCETEDGQRRETVEIALVDARPGGLVLVHAGTAIA
jgi:hydrogenase maturation factor